MYDPELLAATSSQSEQSNVDTRASTFGYQGWSCGESHVKGKTGNTEKKVFVSEYFHREGATIFCFLINNRVIIIIV